MESRSTIVRYFSLVSLLSISCISFASISSLTADTNSSNKTNKHLAIGSTVGAATGVAGAVAFYNKESLAKVPSQLATYLKFLRSAGSVVAAESTSVVTEIIPAVVSPSCFSGVLSSVQSGISSSLTSVSNGLSSSKSTISSALTLVGNGLSSAKSTISSGLTSVGNSLVTAKNGTVAFGSRQIENAGYYLHKTLTGSKDCGNAVLDAVKNNPKTSGAVVLGAAGIALAVHHRKVLAQKAGEFYTGTKNLLVNNAAYFGPLAAVLTVEAGKALLNSNFYARSSVAATAYFNKQA